MGKLTKIERREQGKDEIKMKSKGFLSLLLAVAMILSLAPVSAFADDTVKSVTANFTAQADGEFLCAPQLGAEVRSDTAENYGFEDSVTEGVSVLDALVRLHEVKYGKSFTKETASDYLAISEYGSTSKSFGYSIAISVNLTNNSCWR